MTVWTGQDNTDALVKKGNSRLFLLRRLRSFGVQGPLLRTFYDSVVASAIFYGIVCWASSITDRDRRRMDRLVRASSDLGCPLDSVEVVGNGRMMAKLSSLLNNTSHPLQDTLTALGSSFSERLLHPRCVKESPVLYSLFTHNCVASHKDNTILKFADDTTVMGLIFGGDETAYRSEVASLVKWCDRKNNLSLNTDKTKEMVLDMRRERRQHQPLMITDSEVECVSSFKLTSVMTWTLNIAQHHPAGQEGSSAAVLTFLRRLRKSGMTQRTQRTYLHRRHREHPDQLQHAVVREQHCCRPQMPTESGEDGREDRPGTTALSAGHQPPQSPQESLQHHQNTPPPPAGGGAAEASETERQSSHGPTTGGGGATGATSQTQGRGCCSLSRDAQTSLTPDTSSSSSEGDSRRHSQASQET
ncbi:hypothetical protein L3Q82_008122 [Scortum barcoo]|uniref:Uncharacterized protein n=1 Tax=Scortum barcoo TaxID=214431 RepID=A0ACB8WH16_9TELE|nr:hypothetical protein L3Q82_008122 [Scortum barcoo]